jgi:hypothetical protein
MWTDYQMLQIEISQTMANISHVMKPEPEPDPSHTKSYNTIPQLSSLAIHCSFNISDMQLCVKLQEGSSELLHQLKKDLFTGGNSWAKFNNRKANQMKSTHISLSYHPTATLLFFLHLLTVVKSVLESCRNADKKKLQQLPYHIVRDPNSLFWLDMWLRTLSTVVLSTAKFVSAEGKWYINPLHEM